MDVSRQTGRNHTTCQHCGKSYLALPPDYKPLLASMNRRQESKGEIKMVHNCGECGRDNILYWYRE